MGGLSSSCAVRVVSVYPPCTDLVITLGPILRRTGAKPPTYEDESCNEQSPVTYRADSCNGPVIYWSTPDDSRIPRGNESAVVWKKSHAHPHLVSRCGRVAIAEQRDGHEGEETSTPLSSSASR